MYMHKFKFVSRLILATLVCLLAVDVSAATRSARRVRGKGGLSAICTNIQDFNPRQMFWKNNKPHRASSAINSPVIGYFKQMTLGNNVGFRSSVGSKAVELLDSKGGHLTTMIPYPCRSDHCGGRVVGSGQTDITRRLAISRTRSPVGYVALGKGLCIKIQDIGRCYGNEVSMNRPLCNQTVG